MALPRTQERRKCGAKPVHEGHLTAPTRRVISRMSRLPVTDMQVASVTLRVHQRKRVEALSAIDELMRQMRGSPGCLSCRLLVDAVDGTDLMLISEWDERRDVEAFLGSRNFLILTGMRILLREDPQAVLDEITARTRVSLKR
jgi:quinol monooxygenase YgiN